jgi:hypothetical protein
MKYLIAFWMALSMPLAQSQSTCDAPINLDQFYGIDQIGYRISKVALSESYMLMLLMDENVYPAKYYLWTQYLGVDGKLDVSDKPNIQFVGALDTYPLKMAISNQGWMALYVEDQRTFGRTVPGTSNPLPRDLVLYTCHSYACTSTWHEVERFIPRDHYLYFPYQNPVTEFMIDGFISGMHFDTVLGSDTLVYSMVQDDNPYTQPGWMPPWIGGINPVNPYSLHSSHAAVNIFEPSGGQKTNLRTDNWGGSVTQYILSPSIQGRGDGHNTFGVTEIFSGQLFANNYGLKFNMLTLDPTQAQADFEHIINFDQTANPYWNMLSHHFTMGKVISPMYGEEKIVVGAKLESPQPSPTAQSRDVVYRVESDNYSSENFISPPNDGRSIKHLVSLNRQDPGLTVAGNSYLLAVNTYVRYQPVLQAGYQTKIYVFDPALHEFQLFQEVVTSFNESFMLVNGNGHNLIGELWSTNPLSVNPKKNMSYVFFP